jgi:hypothetical protein
VSVRGYTLGILWSRAGDYTGPLEDVSSYVPKSPDIVASWGRGDPRATADGVAGKLDFVLNNYQRQFSPENTASPIAGRQVPGTPVRLTVADPAAGGATLVYQGPLDTLAVDTSASNKEFTGSVLDGWGKPGASKLSTQVYQGQRTGDLIGIILDTIGWDAAARDIDPGVTLVPYWWLENVDAGTAVIDLVHSEGVPAITYVQNGVFVFRDRHHRVTEADSLTSQGIYTHIIPAGPRGTDHKILRGQFSYDHGLDYIINSATIEVAPWLPSRREIVWATEDTIMLDAGETITVVIRTDDPFVDLQLPTVDVYLNDNTFTQDYHLAQGAVSFGLSRTSGQSALLTITAGIGGALLDAGLAVRGTPLRQGAARKFSAIDPDSQKTYGDNDWDGTAPWAHYYDAAAIVDRMVSIYSQPRPSVTFSVDGALGAETLTRILATQISDRIITRNDEIGLNADFHVEQITHTVMQLGLRHVLTIGAQVVEPYQADLPFVFDAAGQGFGQGEFGMDTGLNPATMFRFDVSGKGFGQANFAT